MDAGVRVGVPSSKNTAEIDIREAIRRSRSILTMRRPTEAVGLARIRSCVMNSSERAKSRQGGPLPSSRLFAQADAA